LPRAKFSVAIRLFSVFVFTAGVKARETIESAFA